MNAPRPLTDRIQDRLWSILTRRLARDLPEPDQAPSAADSVSGSMGWPKACAALASGRLPSRGFRRLGAVMEVVETLGPCEGRHHAERIRDAGLSSWFDNRRFRQIAGWGDPITWPGLLMGTPAAFAPTSLRYLSHALWLNQSGFVGDRARVVEIGTGYGGLAAINALVSSASTLLVDLPEVESAAMKAITELGFAGSASCASAGDPDDGGPFDCLVSNYAFTELSADLQQRMIQRHAVRSRHGMIISNAKVFAPGIGGMDNGALVDALRAHGIEAVLSESDAIRSPADRAFGSVLISW